MEKVIIILCDTLRAKSLPHYGNERNTIPNLTPIIDEDFTVYQRAYAPSPWTTPSHLSLFTGLYPLEVMETPSALQLNPNFRTLSDLFKDSGYKTIALSANELISKISGFDKGFDMFLQLWLPDPNKDEINLGLKGNDFEKALKLFRKIGTEDNRGDILKVLREKTHQKIYKRFRKILEDSTPSTNRAMHLLRQHISENRDERLFCFVNLMQTHGNYNPPKATRNSFGPGNKEYDNFYLSHNVFDHYAIEPFSKEFLEYLKLRYEEEILYLDIVISDFIKWLKDNKLYDSCNLIITSDHGEHFGENNNFFHFFSVYEPVIKIPMYIKWHGRSENISKVENEPVMLQDLYSTFLNLLNHWQPPPDSSVDLTSADKRSWALSQLPDMSYSLKGCKSKRNDFSLRDLGLKGNSLNAYVFKNGIKIIENDDNVSEYNLERDLEEKSPMAVDRKALQTLKTRII